MPHLWANKLLNVILMVAVAAAVALLAMAVLRGKGRRRRPLLAALCCLATAAVMAVAGLALIFLVQLPALARERWRQSQARFDAVSLVHAGDQAPSFRLTDTSGRVFDLGNQRGKVVLVVVFGTRCGACKEQLPHLQRLWDGNCDSTGFGMLAIGVGETNETVSAFQRDHGWSLPMAPDPERSVYSLYAREAIPRTYLVSPDGTICLASTGSYEENMTSLQTELGRQLRSAR